MRTYFIYILTNRNKTVLYTGVTNDLQRRMKEHRAGTTVGFTAKYDVYHLLYREEYSDIVDAIAREKEIKGWRREKKERLIATQNPHWQFLEEEA